MITLMNSVGEILIDTKEIKHNLEDFEKVKEELEKIFKSTRIYDDTALNFIKEFPHKVDRLFLYIVFACLSYKKII